VYFGPLDRLLKFSHTIVQFSIDGTYLYEKYKGCLLIATGVDADGELYPLAFAVVERKQNHLGDGSYLIFMN